VLILDEMNRANLPRVFGELLFAIERRGQPIDLLYTRDFRLPEQICFIGTMNTADRNIRSIDAAVRRRFMIFELQPSPKVLAAFYGGRENEVPDLVEGLVALNDQLTQLLDRHHTIGHTYLMDERGMNAGRLNQVWLRQIRPLLEEYLFDMPDELARFNVEAFWPSVGS
jgi:5-methylcytosine-specific restriction endonuclease McrBC GTP-binding regulatory subunit McrB